MKYLTASILLGLALLSNNALAIDNDGNFAIWGYGNKSCYSFNIAKDGDEAPIFKHYLMGYLTASNIQITDTYRISGKMDMNEILAWLTEHCQKNPVTSFSHALANFIIEHHDKRMKQSPAGFRR